MEVVSYAPGEGAGFGQVDLPGIVLGPPAGLGLQAGSLDVLSLGSGGEIVLRVGERGIVDGPGPDFVVFENAFWPGGDPGQAFMEPAEVAVSEDGETWHVFPCDVAAATEEALASCAGWRPVLAFDAQPGGIEDPATVGGDPFDLADLGVPSARLVRIRDLGPGGEPPSAGFDLDAVGVVHNGDAE